MFYSFPPVHADKHREGKSKAATTSCQIFLQIIVIPNNRIIPNNSHSRIQNFISSYIIDTETDDQPNTTLLNTLLHCSLPDGSAQPACLTATPEPGNIR